MKFRDDGNHVRALGFVALRSMELEDELAELVAKARSFASLRNGIEKFRLSDQARHLRKGLKRIFGTGRNYAYGDEHEMRILRILKAVERVAEFRNEMLHSPIYVARNGVTMQKRQNGGRPIESREIYRLAEVIEQVSSAVYGLTFDVERMHLSLRSPLASPRLSAKHPNAEDGASRGNGTD